MFRKKILRRLRRHPRVSTGNARIQRGLDADPITLFSHELRTPLHGISGMLELLGRSELAEHQQQMVHAMQRCCHSLASMLNGAIEIPGLYSSQRRLPPGPFDLARELEDTIAMYQGWASTRSVELSYSISGDIPAVILADRGRLRQVLGNLLSNAIKYASGSVVSVSVSGCPEERAALRFRVADTGAGGKQGVRQPDTGIYSSSGLGLNLSRLLVKTVGGSLSVSRPEDGGTCASFTFPAAPASHESGMAVACSSLLQRRSVLVIMREETRQSVCCHLQRWGVPHTTQDPGSVELHGGTDAVILELFTAAGGDYRDLQKIRRHVPRVPVAVLLPFATKSGRWSDTAGVTVIRKPVTRSRLAAWLIACSLKSDTAD